MHNIRQRLNKLAKMARRPSNRRFDPIEFALQAAMKKLPESQLRELASIPDSDPRPELTDDQQKAVECLGELMADVQRNLR